MKNTRSILNAPFTLLIFGFLLSGVLGTYLSYLFQNNAWKQKIRHEIALYQLEETKSTIEDILILGRKRFYAMQKVYWALESYDTSAAQENWQAYCAIKDEWNISIENYRSKIKVLLDSDLAYSLLDQNDARRYTSQPSVHASFVKTHNVLKRFYECPQNSETRRQLEGDTLNSLTCLSDTLRTFSENCYGAYKSQRIEFERGYRK